MASPAVGGLDEGALAAAWASRSETPAAPAQETAQPDPAPVEGTTPPAEAAPATVSEGLTPPAQPPAPVVEDQDLAFALEKAGITKDDPQALVKLAKLYRETNNRTAQFANELEALKKAPPVPQVQQVPQAPPAPQQTLEQHILGLVQQDREYTSLSRSFQALDTELNAIATLDDYGRVSGGRMLELNNEIASLQSLLSSNDTITKLGLKAPELDVFQQQEIRAQLSMLNAEKAEKRLRFREIGMQQDELRKSYGLLKQRYTDHFESQAAEKEQAEQQEKEINEEAEKFKKEWNGAFSALATAKSVPEAMLKTLWSRLVRSAKANDGAIQDLNSWMTAEIDSELKTMDEYHRFRSGQHATLKRADVQESIQPANPAAVAPPAPGTTGSWEDRLRERDRAIRSR
jgi:hypothetical protein